jgi:hypothetical protein
LLHCLRLVQSQSETLALVFLDQMGYYRWPAAATDWTAVAPAPPPVAQRTGADGQGANNQQWRLAGALNACTGQVDYKSPIRTATL